MLVTYQPDTLYGCKNLWLFLEAKRMSASTGHAIWMWESLVIFGSQKEVRINRTSYMDVRIFGYFWKPKGNPHQPDTLYGCENLWLFLEAKRKSASTGHATWMWESLVIFESQTEVRINRTRYMDLRIFDYFWKPKGSPQVRDVWGTLISTSWFFGSLEQWTVSCYCGRVALPNSLPHQVGRGRRTVLVFAQLINANSTASNSRPTMQQLGNVRAEEVW